MCLTMISSKFTDLILLKMYVFFVRKVYLMFYWPFFYQPETFVKVRPRCEAPRRDMIYPMNYTPCRYVRISCLRGNPIAVFFIQVIYDDFYVFSDPDLGVLRYSFIVHRSNKYMWSTDVANCN